MEGKAGKMESGWFSWYSDRLRSGQSSFNSQERKTYLFSTVCRPASRPTQPPIQYVRGAPSRE
jgi:hypothetical protein